MNIPNKWIVKVGIIFTLCIMLIAILDLVEFIFIKKVNIIYLYSIVYVVCSLLLAFLAARYLKNRQLVFITLFITVSLVGNLVITQWSNTKPISDFGLLYELAENLKNGNSDSLKNNDYFLRWAYQSFFVIYESIISAFPNGITVLLAVNALIMSGINFVMYLILHNVYGKFCAIFVSVLYLFYPAPYFLASVLTNQHISLFFILLGVLVFVQKNNIKHGIISGLLIAIGDAFRPDTVLITISLVFVGAIIFLLHIKSHRKKSIILALPSLISASTCIILVALFSALIILSDINPNGLKNTDPLWKFVVGVNVETNGVYSNKLAAEVFSISDINARHTLEADIINRNLKLDKNTLSLFFRNKFRTIFTQNEYYGWMIAGQDGRYVPIINKPLKSVLNVLTSGERIYFLIMFLLSFASLVITVKNKDVPILLLLCGLVFVLFVGIHLFIEFQSRYRYFVMPFIFILSGDAIDTIFILICRKKSLTAERSAQSF